MVDFNGNGEDYKLKPKWLRDEILELQANYKELEILNKHHEKVEFDHEKRIKTMEELHKQQIADAKASRRMYLTLSVTILLTMLGWMVAYFITK